LISEEPSLASTSRRIFLQGCAAIPLAQPAVGQLDDAELVADGSDATWLTFGAADKYGTLRPFVDGEVTLTIKGPGGSWETIHFSSRTMVAAAR
jgi:hypothetical protein